MDRPDPTTPAAETPAPQSAGPTPALPEPLPEPVAEPLPDSPSEAILELPEEPKPEPPRATPARLLFTIAAAFVVIFLFLRTFALEPFGVPTGSMSPTLIGNHREVPCPRCGYPVRVGLPSAGDRSGHFNDVPCPNCGKKMSLSQATDINGDRLLVDKNIFNLRSPRRWEVVVFHCKADLSKPYVKRLIGLPGELIRIIDGDVYANGELLRKSLREVRDTRIPIFDLNYTPNTGGWGPRFLVSPPEADPRLPSAPGHQPAPADESVLADHSLIIDASQSPQSTMGVEYRNWNLDEKIEEPIRSSNSYNGSVSSLSNLYAVHDFAVDCEVEVVAAARGARFTLRLFDGSEAVMADVSVGPRSAGRASLSSEPRGELVRAGPVALEPGSTYHVEYAFVDRRATLAIDGRVVIAPADLPTEAKRGEVKRPLLLRAHGCHVVVRNLRIYRDIHYTQAGNHGTRQPARLGAKEYFVLGDNSASSMDSREWNEPGVPETDFIGKPFLVHQPLRQARIRIAGRERTFQTLDWSRLRWMH